MLIFLSHASVDKPIAEFVRETLLSLCTDCEVFVSSKPGQIPADKEWWDVIRKKLRSANAYLLLLTPHSATRPWVFFEFGAAWMSKRTLVAARAASFAAESLAPPLSIQQSLNLENPEDAVEIFRALGLTLRHPAEFSASIAALGRDAHIEALRAEGWAGIDWNGTYYAWAGPLAGMSDYKPESEPPGLVGELARLGVSPSWANESKISKHRGEGKQVVYATDRKSWRRLITNADLVLVVTAPQESAVARATRLHTERAEEAERIRFERSRGSVAVATEQIKLLYDAIERLGKVVAEQAPDLQIVLRRTPLDLLVQSGHTCFRLAWRQRYSDSIFEARVFVEEYLGLPELQADNARPNHEGVRQSSEAYALINEKTRGWCWTREKGGLSVLTASQLAERVFELLMSRLENPLPQNVVRAWYRR